MSWNYNYGQFSTVQYGDKMTLLNNPDLLASEGSVSLSAAIWFFMFPQAPKPSMHELANKTYVASDYDRGAGLG